MKPQFIGIGAARAGTTWLFKMLDEHPDVWMPRRKELHYFSRSPGYFGPSHLWTGGRVPRLVGVGPGSDKYRVHFFRALGSNILKPSREKLLWDMDYFFRRPTNDWYKSLFDDAGHKTAGEITPQYSVLTPWDIGKIKDALPSVKVIFIMRDPVERIWSLIKYHEKRWHSGLTSQAIDRLLEEAFHPAKVEQSDYETILRNWRFVFPESQFFTCFFDQIIEEPDRLSRDLANFLGLAVPTSSLQGGKVNASSDKRMPSELRKILQDYYAPMVRRLSDSEGGYFSKWLESYETA